jgi:soluble lytic murein transglycosylase-like protein
MAGGATTRLESLQLGPLLDEWASRYGLDRALVYGLVAHESGFNPQAYRAEIGIGDASYGLTQVLYRTAQAEGYSGPPSGLFDPTTNLHYGLSYLRRMLDRFNSYEPTALAAYNGGPGIVRSDGSYPNTAYVNAVLAEWAYYQQYLGSVGWQPGTTPNPFAVPAPQESGMLWLGAALLLAVVFGSPGRRSRRASSVGR